MGFEVKKKKLALVLACRNNGTRLYGKPLQILNEKKNISVLDFIILQAKKQKSINSIILAVAEGKHNEIYEKIAKYKKIKYIVGSEQDVLKRLIKSAEKCRATDLLRITSESPFTFWKNLNFIWNIHKKNNYDASFLDNIIDGCGFEILNLKTLKSIYKKTNKIEKEHCSLYLRKNYKKFKIKRFFPEIKLQRYDIRLTVDYPEDLVLCRYLFKKYKNIYNYDIKNIIKLLDKNKSILKLVRKYTEVGYKSMYRWGK